MTDHAKKLRRNAEKVGRPAGDVPAVMHQAAAHIEDLERRLREVIQHRNALLSALKEARESLQFAADSPGGLGADTIWMMHRHETLFDFMDAAIENQPAKNED